MYVLWCRSLIQCLIVSFSVPVNEVENNQNIRFILIVFFVFLGAFTALTIILRVIRRKTCKPIIMKGILLREFWYVMNLDNLVQILEHCACICLVYSAWFHVVWHYIWKQQQQQQNMSCNTDYFHFKCIVNDISNYIYTSSQYLIMTLLVWQTNPYEVNEISHSDRSRTKDIWQRERFGCHRAIWRYGWSYDWFPRWIESTSLQLQPASSLHWGRHHIAGYRKDSTSLPVYICHIWRRPHWTCITAADSENSALSRLDKMIIVIWNGQLDALIMNTGWHLTVKSEHLCYLGVRYQWM